MTPSSDFFCDSIPNCPVDVDSFYTPSAYYYDENPDCPLDNAPSSDPAIEVPLFFAISLLIFLCSVTMYIPLYHSCSPVRGGTCSISIFIVLFMVTLGLVGVSMSVEINSDFWLTMTYASFTATGALVVAFGAWNVFRMSSFIHCNRCHTRKKKVNITQNGNIVVSRSELPDSIGSSSMVPDSASGQAAGISPVSSIGARKLRVPDGGAGHYSEAKEEPIYAVPYQSYERPSADVRVGNGRVQSDSDYSNELANGGSWKTALTVPPAHFSSRSLDRRTGDTNLYQNIPRVRLSLGEPSQAGSGHWNNGAAFHQRAVSNAPAAGSRAPPLSPRRPHNYDWDMLSIGEVINPALLAKARHIRPNAGITTSPPGRAIVKPRAPLPSIPPPSRPPPPPPRMVGAGDSNLVVERYTTTVFSSTK